MNELALFAGGGGGLYASLLLGHTPVCAVEINKHSRNMLLQRQCDGIFPRFPIWDDVQTFDGLPWRGKIDIITGGFPCQDISVAGTGAGLDGERSGLWREFARIIGEVRPRYAYIENSPALIGRGLDRVLCDLAALGYDAEWIVMGAHHVAAPHERERIWILAYTMRHGLQGHSDAGYGGETHEDALRRAPIGRSDPAGIFPHGGGQRCNHENTVPSARDCFQRDWAATGEQKREDLRIEPRTCGATGEIPHNHGTREQQPQGRKQDQRGRSGHSLQADFRECDWWTVEPDMGRVVHGVAHWKHRIFALGNGQVPRVAAEAFVILMSRIHGSF